MPEMTGPVFLDELVTVTARYDPGETWNGFLCPRLDRNAVETVMAAFPDESGESDLQAPSHRWEGNVLHVTEYDGDESYTETLHPDDDGLYALGARAWVWSGDLDRATPVSPAKDAQVLSLDDWKRCRRADD